MEGPNQAKKAATTAVSPGLYVHGAEKGNHCEAGVLGEIFSSVVFMPLTFYPWPIYY